MEVFSEVSSDLEQSETISAPLMTLLKPDLSPESDLDRDCPCGVLVKEKDSECED